MSTLPGGRDVAQFVATASFYSILPNLSESPAETLFSLQPVNKGLRKSLCLRGSSITRGSPVLTPSEAPDRWLIVRSDQARVGEVATLFGSGAPCSPFLPPSSALFIFVITSHRFTSVSNAKQTSSLDLLPAAVTITHPPPIFLSCPFGFLVVAALSGQLLSSGCHFTGPPFTAAET